MKSYIKIYGPPHRKAIIELEKIAVDMPQVCILDTMISREIPSYLAKDLGGTAVNLARGEWVGEYYKRHSVVVPVERCQSIISSSGDSLGDFDFFYEWLEGPFAEPLNMLIEKIDGALESLGCRYSITTK